MGLTTIRSSAARAPEGLERAGGTDIYELVAIEPDRRLPDPTRLIYLRLEVEGLDQAGFAPALLTGGRQRLQDGVLEIRRETLPSHEAYRRPYTDSAPDMSVFLEPEFNIESDDPEIVAKAREISGADRNPVSAAQRLTNWVFRNIEKKPVLAMPSAREALRTRVGDCNEHATLLAALLRASGVPARLSIGLVYTREKFYYHAWTEAYLGEWISMDATLNQMPADASHIKLVEGNLDKQMEIAGLFGELKVKVIDFQHD
jgi:transglutaminase-like putative cysteine protease